MSPILRWLLISAILAIPLVTAFAQDTPPDSIPSEQPDGAQADVPGPTPTVTSSPLPTAGRAVLPTASTLPGLAPTVVPGVASDAARLDQAAQRVETAARANDWAAARERYRQFDDLWFDVEDGFRSAYPSAYRDIERAMGAVVDELRPAEPTQAGVLSAVSSLRGLLGSLIVPVSTDAVATAAPSPTAGDRPSAQSNAAYSVATAIPTLRSSSPTPTATTVPSTCLTPSLTLSGSSVSSDSVLAWQARGFKPGTAVEIEVLGPTNGVASGQELFEIEEQVVGSRCEVIVEPAEFIKGRTFRQLGAPSGTYILQVEGLRYYPPDMTLGVQEQRMRLVAPFSYHTVNH